MSFSIDGIVSGFDTSSVIESLLGFQQNQVETFNARKADITTEQTAFKGIEAQLLTLQSSLTQLNRTTSSVFDSVSATSTHEDILRVAADNGAIQGTYQVTVQSLATAHQIGSQGFSESSDQIGTGTITFQVGSGAATTITVDQGNNTLESLAASINDQVEDVSAGIIFDQGSSSYRLLLTSAETGADNVINVTNTLDSNTGIVPDFSGPAIQEAANAVLTLGSGPGAISASYASNQIDGLIQDVTIDLRSAAPDTTVTIDLERDTESAKAAIEGFVENYNSVIEFIENQTRFNPDTEEASPLLGNRSVINIKNRLFSLATNTIVTGTSTTRLSQIGIDINISGQLTLDSGKLDKALGGQLDDVDPKDIRKLFGLNASSTNAGIEFLTGGVRTAHSDVPYQVDITQAAERATVTATSALASSVVIDGSNDQLQITLDGVVSESLTLNSGTYTQEQLASHVQETINNSTELASHNVIVSLDNQQLVITSEAYGSESAIASLSGSASSTLGFSGTESDTGQDVAGVFIVDGVEEIAKGTGRLLVGDSENEHTADLQLLVKLSTDQVVSGSDADLLVSRGVTGQLNQLVNGFLDAETGILKTVEDEFETRLESIDQSIARVEEITNSRRESLIEEFTALESILNELQTTGSFISSQLSSIRSISNNNSNNS